MYKKIVWCFFALCLGLLVSCDTNSSDDDESSSGSEISKTNATHASIIVKNDCTKILVKTKIGFSTFTVNLGGGKTSKPLSLPVDPGVSKAIHAEWLNFQDQTIKSYAFIGGHTYEITYHATPYAPLRGATYLKNVYCSIVDTTSN